MKKKNTIWIYLLMIIGTFLLATNSCKKDNTTNNNNSNTVKDLDGNVYHTITIGTQTWMVENLKTTKFSDSTVIPHVTSMTDWAALRTPGFCTYNNTTNADTINTYGRLYNWYTVNTGKLCPTGWHVPTDAEWTTLENYLIANGYNYDGSTAGNMYAKALASATGWSLSTIAGAVGNTDFSAKRNASGFTAVAGGYRYYSESIYGNNPNIGKNGYWWTSSEFSTAYAFYRSMYFDSDSVENGNYNKRFGLSVRCLKD